MVNMKEFINKSKNFMLSPVNSFKEVKDESLDSSIKYFILWAVISSILYGITFQEAWKYYSSPLMIKEIEHFLFGNVYGAPLTILLILFFLSLSSIFLFVNSLWLHMWIKLMGGSGDIHQTIKIMIYSATPVYIMGWIPFVGRLIGIWSFVIALFGIRELHGMSLSKAAAAAIISSIIFVILISAFVFFFVFSMKF